MDLQSAGDYLRQGIQQLVGCDSFSGQTAAPLRRAAVLLELLLLRLREHPEQLPPDRAALRALLQEVKRRSDRAHLLLDSAAAFYCGITLDGPAVAETYTPDGSWQTLYPNDRICLNA